MRPTATRRHTRKFTSDLKDGVNTTRVLIWLVACMWAVVSSCGSPDRASLARIQAGDWTGGLTPMNHPDMETPLQYQVSYDGDVLQIALHGPDDTVMPARDPVLDGDTLRFSFEEPEENVTLRCALGRQADRSFEGRCTDDESKWARFTMIPPSE